MAWLLNLVAFQLGWLACVLGGAQSAPWPWLGTAFALVLIVIHIRRAAQPRQEAILVAGVGLIGFIIDSGLLVFGFTQFPSGSLYPNTAPHWIVAMWMLFATTLNVSMSWLHGRYPLAAVLGAVGGPLAYYAGFKLDAVTFPRSLLAGLIALAIVWTFIMPLLMRLAKRWNGTRPVLSQPA